MALSTLNAPFTSSRRSYHSYSTPFPFQEDRLAAHDIPEKLRRVVKEASEAVGTDELLTLVRKMPVRCEAVIDAEEGWNPAKRVRCAGYAAASD